MIQTGNLQIDALIKELEAQCLGLLEANAQKAAEIAGLQEELKAFKKLEATPSGEQPSEIT